MNYYPNNFYQNYSYGNAYTPYSQPSTPQMSPIPSQLSQQISNLQGKIVDGEEVVKATEVPFGGYGVFPKADLSEVYVKTWNGDGTTKIVTYKPIVAQSNENEKEIDTNTLILNKIQDIENKLDNLSSLTSKEKEKKKEIANAY